MKLRAGLFALMISLVFLSGCSSADESTKEEFEQYRANLGNISMTAQLRADYGDTVADFKLQYHENSDNCHVDVIEPELISGAGVTISRDDASLEYDGIILSVGELSVDGLSPVTVLPAIAEALHEWQLTDLYTQTDDDGYYLSAELSDMDSLTVTLCFDEGMNLLSAELAVTGATVAYCDVSAWSVN